MSRYAVIWLWEEWAARRAPSQRRPAASSRPGMGCVCLRLVSGCVPVHVSQRLLFPWLRGPDAQNVPGLQCVSCPWFVHPARPPLLSSSLPSLQRSLVKQAVT